MMATLQGLPAPTFAVHAFLISETAICASSLSPVPAVIVRPGSVLSVAWSAVLPSVASAAPTLMPALFACTASGCSATALFGQM